MYKISGKVIKGQAYGRTIGFPTANIDRREYQRSKLKLKFGVYAGGVWLNQRYYKAGIVIGPVDQNNLPKLEAHLIGYSGNLYGQKLVLELHRYLRPFKKYSGEAELKRAIQNDIKKIKQLKY